MRNDARPIGEEFRDIAEHDRPENPANPPAEQAREHNKPFVTDRDPGDEEFPPEQSDR